MKMADLLNNLALLSHQHLHNMETGSQFKVSYKRIEKQAPVTPGLIVQHIIKYTPVSPERLPIQPISCLPQYSY